MKPDGEDAWSYDMPDGGAPTFAVLTNRNRIIAGAQAGPAIGLNLDGREAWRFDTRNAPYGTSERQIVRSNPVVAPNYPNVLIGTDAGNLYELDDGAYKGIRRAEAPIRAGAAIAPDGTLIWTSLDRTLYAGVPGGGDRWRKALDGQVSATPAIAADGTVYVATEAGTVFAVRADGSERWHTGIGGGKAIRSGPVLAPNGAVYATADDGRLYALNPSRRRRPLELRHRRAGHRLPHGRRQRPDLPRLERRQPVRAAPGRPAAVPLHRRGPDRLRVAGHRGGRHALRRHAGRAGLRAGRRRSTPGGGDAHAGRRRPRRRRRPRQTDRPDPDRRPGDADGPAPH